MCLAVCRHRRCGRTLCAPTRAPTGTGLPKDSVVNVSQILTIDKAFLTQRIGVLAGRLFREVESGVRLVLSL